MTFLSQFATTTPPKADLFSMLGIDWRLLILQIIAFLVLVAILGKFVYPWLIKQVDARQADIEAASEAAVRAQKMAQANQEKVTELLEEAREEAAEIVDTATSESADMLSASEKRALDLAERIVAGAHEQLDKDIANARKTLYNDTLELVALATEKVVKAKLDKKADSALIATAVKQTKETK